MGLEWGWRGHSETNINICAIFKYANNWEEVKFIRQMSYPIQVVRVLVAVYLTEL